MIEYIEKDTARRIINSPRTKEQMLAMLEGSFTMALPKHHGRLIDADVLVEGMEDDYEFCEAVNATPTIIEADKESEDKSVSAILDDMKSGVDGLIDDGLKMIEKRRERINENT